MDILQESDSFFSVLGWYRIALSVSVAWKVGLPHAELPCSTMQMKRQLSVAQCLSISTNSWSKTHSQDVKITTSITVLPQIQMWSLSLCFLPPVSHLVSPLRYRSPLPSPLLPLRCLHLQFEWQIWFVVQTARGWFYFTGFSLFQLGHDSDSCSVIWASTPPQWCCFRLSYSANHSGRLRAVYADVAPGCRDVTEYAKSSSAET